jgi:hypothetical protein
LDEAGLLAAHVAANGYMTLARHAELLAQHEPPSQRQAVALIELKAQTPHGEWDANVNRDLHLQSARQTAFNLMALAD